MMSWAFGCSDEDVFPAYLLDIFGVWCDPGLRPVPSGFISSCGCADGALELPLLLFSLSYFFVLLVCPWRSESESQISSRVRGRLIGRKPVKDSQIFRLIGFRNERLGTQEL